jgi:hypothetical protein
MATIHPEPVLRARTKNAGYFMPRVEAWPIKPKCLQTVYKILGPSQTNAGDSSPIVPAMARMRAPARHQSTNLAKEIL